MSFQSPLMLVGLLFVAVPVWLHLKTRRAAEVPFPAFPLLAETVARRRPRIRLRKRLLLLIRVMLVIAAVTAAARPAVTVIRAGGIRIGAPAAMVIVVDNSMSMQLEDENGESLFEKARAAAARELDRLRPGDAAWIMGSCDTDEPPQTVDFDLVQSLTALENIRVTFRPGRLKQKLMSALRLLEDCPLTQREVLLITDLSEGEDLELPPWSPSTQVEFRVLDPAPTVPRTNAAVTEVRVTPSAEGVFREVQVEAKISNFSSRPKKKLDVFLEIEGREAARGTMDLPPHSSVIKRFFHRFTEDGVFRGTVRIPEDRLRADDRRYFAVSVSHALSVLIIDGDYRPGSYYDEAFYLQRALETHSPGEVPIRTSTTDMETALNLPLSGHDAVFLVGAPTLSEVLAGRLIQYVKKGGGLFLSPDEHSGAFDRLSPILPAEVRSIRQTVRSRPFGVGSVNRAHPLFEPFGDGPSGLEKTVIYRHLLFEPGASDEARTLMDTADGLPLLWERTVERGRVILLGVPVDRAWSDLPIRPGFLPLVQRAARRLAGRLDDRNPKPVETGRPVHIEVSEGMQRLTVRGPGDRDTVYTAKELDGKSHVVFTGTQQPGEYAVWTEIPRIGGLKEQPSLGFSVVVHNSESDLSRKISTTANSETGQLAEVAGKLPVWPYLLALAVLLVLLETLAASAGLRRSHFRLSRRREQYKEA